MFVSVREKRDSRREAAAQQQKDEKEEKVCGRMLSFASADTRRLLLTRVSSFEHLTHTDRGYFRVCSQCSVYSSAGVPSISFAGRRQSSAGREMKRKLASHAGEGTLTQDRNLFPLESPSD